MRRLLEKLATPRARLVGFVGGSLFVMLVCLVVAASSLGAAFLKKEANRSAVARDQLLHAFAVQLNQMSEEMWTGSFEAIALRVERTARQFGNIPHELYLLGEDKLCVHSSQPGCRVPDQARSQLDGAKNLSEQNPSLVFDESTSRHSYIVPLGVGTIVKGYLVARLGDPYDFYRGGITGLWAETLLPLVAAILLAWSAWLALSYRFLLRPYLGHLVKLEREEALAALARQVAHDIRNPVSALDKLLCALPAGPATPTALMRTAIRQIHDIANNLLAAPSGDSQKKRAKPRIEPLSRVAASVISQMRLRWKGSPVRLEFQESPETLACFAKIEAGEMRRALSNLINNAFEAVEGAGWVRVSLSRVGDEVHLAVEDNGRGIASAVRPLLGKRGATFGKADGHGLGLHQAHAMARAAGGLLDIDSEEGRGTKVTLRLPAAAAPAWFVDRLCVPTGGLVVLVDDDSADHELWRVRWEALSGAGVKLVAFEDAKSARESGELERADLVLCDYDLGKGAPDGMSLIEGEKLAEKSILVTHHAEDEEVQDLCLTRGIRLLPKDWLGMVAIVPSQTAQGCEEETTAP
jgi:signal transduction histidine kinase